MNRHYTYFCALMLLSSSLLAIEVDETNVNTSQTPIEILTQAFSELQGHTNLETPTFAGVPAPVIEKSGPAVNTKGKEVKEEKTQAELSPISSSTSISNLELASTSPVVGEVDNEAEKLANALLNESDKSYKENSENYLKNYSNADSLRKQLGSLSKGPTNQLLNQAGLTPSLAKQAGTVIAEAPKSNPEGGMFDSNSSKSSFGFNNSDITSSFKSISKPSGQSLSEQLQDKFNEQKKKEKDDEKKLEEKKEQLGKDIKKFAELQTPITQENYNEFKNFFQDKDNVSLLNEMKDLDPNFFNNAHESYYGIEGEGDHGVRDNDRIGKLPLLNFIDQFKEKFAENPEIFKERNKVTDPNKFIQHDRSLSNESH